MADEIKVVNGTQLDAALELIGNAIRTKGETTERFPSAAAMAAAIEAIQAGGGFDPAPFSKVEVSTVKFSSPYTSIYVVTEDPGNVICLEIVAMEIPKDKRAFPCLAHLCLGEGAATGDPFGSRPEDLFGNIADNPRYGFSINFTEPDGTVSSGYSTDVGLMVRYDKTTGELILSEDGAFAPNVTYAVITVWGART